MKNVAFVTTFCPHHREKTFEILSSYYKTHFFFFSLGDEWYWQKKHGVRAGNFSHKYLWGFRIGRTRFTPTLPIALLKNDYDVYIKCINGRFALPVTYLIARFRRKPFILWTGIWTRLTTSFHRLAWFVTRYIYHHADAIVVYGEHVKRYLVAEGVNPRKVFVAPHAVDNESYSRDVPEEDRQAMREQLGIGSTHKVVLYLGRLEKIKGLRYLVEAFGMLKRKDSTLVLAGTGSEQPLLMQIAREKGVDKSVRFPGYVPAEKAIAYYAIAYVLVLPSVTLASGKELWGLVVNEAFNQGVPVIATDAVGAAAGGFVQDGINGYVVHEKDTQSLARALQKILDDDGLRNRLGENAKRAVPTWDNEHMVSGFRDAIDSVSQDNA